MLTAEEQLRKRQNAGTLCSDVSAYMKTQAGNYDFALVVPGDSSDLGCIPVHKLILAARSPVLRAMLSSGMKVSCADEMEITGYAVEAVWAFVRFLYCDSCTEAALGEHGWELLGMADKYDVPALRTNCESYFTENLRDDTAASTLCRADAVNAPTLRSKALAFIAANLKSLTRQPQQLDGLSEGLLREVLRAVADGQFT